MSDQEAATIIVLRTDAKKEKFEMNMSDSLNDLKDFINKSDAFGPLPRQSQRLFHMGRELKTGGRSLKAIGLGKFEVFTVHLFAKGRSSGSSQQNKEEEDEDEVVEVVDNSNKRRARRNRVQNARNQQQQQLNQQSVIELSDDDEDDDDVVVEVTVPPKRRRTTQR